MEYKDVKILENLIKNFKNNRELFYEIGYEDVQALKHLIKEYRKLKKENAILKGIYNNKSEGNTAYSESTIVMD